MPVGLILIMAAAALILFGWGQRALDRMRMNDIQALALLAVMFVGFFIPEIRLSSGLSVDVGGALVPLGVAIYLIATAGTATEKSRAIVASLLTFAVVYSTDKLLPSDPRGFRGPMTLDPLWVPALAGGIVAYLLGRSRRSAFIAGVMGVILTDLAVVVQNFLAGVPGALVAVGGGGVFDATVLSGFLALALAEIIGETREALQGGPDMNRPEGLLRGLRGSPAIGREDRGAENGEQPAQPASTGALRDQAFSARGTMALLALAAVLVGGSTVAGPRLGGHPDEVLSGPLFTVSDEAGRVLLQSARWVYKGDEWIDEDNKWYRVTEVKGRRATARLMGVLDLRAELNEQGAAARARVGGGYGRGEGGGKDRLALARQGLPDLALAKRNITVGIYHTHNDESYVTNQGAESVEGRGGIHKVGDAFESALRGKGYKVIHDQTVHLPHDRGAYRRSRRTALRLARDGSDLIFDVHRDAGPWQSYATMVGGKGATKVRLVVGRENPNMSNTLKYAKELKAVADSVHPGLIKGIWFGLDAYNQDISPRSILLELGTEENALPSAQRGITAFADVVDSWVGRNLK